MQFPQWVDAHRSDAKRASARLKFMLGMATLLRFGRTSMHELAAKAGCDHSSIFNSIKRGSFTDSMAEAIEKALGRDVLPREHLTDPLNVGRVIAK